MYEIDLPAGTKLIVAKTKEPTERVLHRFLVVVNKPTLITVLHDMYDKLTGGRAQQLYSIEKNKKLFDDLRTEEVQITYLPFN